MEEENSKRSFKLKTEYIVALSAIFVSIATLAVYMYQANIMQNQLHTSVWPYVQWSYSNVGKEFYLVVENKGIGPALIKSTRMTLDGNEMGSNSDLFKTLLGNSEFDFINSSVNGTVISPGEKVELFHIYDSASAKKLDSLIIQSSSHKFKYTVCYCSVYGDCWTTNGWDVLESKCK